MQKSFSGVEYSNVTYTVAIYIDYIVQNGRMEGDVTEKKYLIPGMYQYQPSNMHQEDSVKRMVGHKESTDGTLVQY